MPRASSTRSEPADIAVVGGGSAGVAAAVAAARCGARVLLLERYGFLGGAATQSLVLTYDGFLYRRPQPEWAVAGIGREFLGRLSQIGGAVEPGLSPNGNWVIPFAPEASKRALDLMLREAGVVCRLHALVTGARLRGGRIERLLAHDHAGAFEVRARGYVDASGEADLAAVAGVPMLHAEGPRYAASLCARIGGVPAALRVDREMLGAVAREALAQQPGAALRAQGGFVLRIPGSDDLWWMGIDVVTDGLGSASLSEAEQRGREAAWLFIETLRRRPGFERAHLVATGPQLGIRETRHPQARRMISETDALAGRRDATGIARAAWNVERHDVPGHARIAAIGGEGWFDIPLDALGAEGVGNLWLAGRTIGADRGAYGSLRVMGTAFASGHAAGVAAALSLQGREAAELPAETVRERLRQQGAIV
jgi:hypothetical protein